MKFSDMVKSRTEREGLMLNASRGNTLVSSNAEVKEFTVLYASSWAGMPFKYTLTHTERSGMLNLVSMVDQYLRETKAKKLPAYFKNGNTQRYLKKQGKIKELLEDRCDWYSDQGISGDIRNSLKDALESILPKELLSLAKNEIQVAMDSSKQAPEDGIDVYTLLNVPACRRVLFDYNLKHKDADISIEYKILDGFLKAHCNTTIHATTQFIVEMANDFSSNNGVAPTEDEFIDLLELETNSSYNFSKYYRKDLFNIHAEMSIVALYLESQILAAIPKMRHSFEDKLAVMEAFWALMTISGSSLIIHEIRDKLMGVGISEEIAKSYAEYAKYYFRSMEGAPDATKYSKDVLDLLKSRLSDEKSDSKITSFIKLVTKNKLDSYDAEKIAEMSEGLTERCRPSSFSAGLNYLQHIEYARTLALIQLRAVHHAFSSDYVKSQKDGKEFDPFLAVNCMTGVEPIAKRNAVTYYSYIFDYDLLSVLFSTILQASIIVEDVKESDSDTFLEPVIDNMGGLADGYFKLLFDCCPNVEKIIKDTNFSPENTYPYAYAVTDYVHDFLTDIEALSNIGAESDKIFKELTALNNGGEFDVEKFTELSAKYAEFKSEEGNVKDKQHELLIQLLRAINDLIEPLTQHIEVKPVSEPADQKQVNEAHKMLGVAEGKINELCDKVRTLGEQVQTLTAKNQALEAKGCANEATDVMPDAVQDYLINGQVANMKAALDIAAYMFPTSLVILPSAYESIETSLYSQPDRVLRELTVLGTEFMDQFKEGGTDLARKLFPTNVYRRGESETVTKNEKLMSSRMHEYEGKKQPFTMHLALGNGQSKTKHCRIYFRPEIARNRVVVAYSGNHLGTTQTC